MEKDGSRREKEKWEKEKREKEKADSSSFIEYCLLSNQTIVFSQQQTTVEICIPTAVSCDNNITGCFHISILPSHNAVSQIHVGVTIIVVY